METSTAPAPEQDPWIFRAFIIIGIICILIEIYRIYTCYQSPCCEFHSLFLNKESTCPVFTLGSGGFTWPD